MKNKHNLFLFFSLVVPLSIFAIIIYIIFSFIQGIKIEDYCQKKVYSNLSKYCQSENQLLPANSDEQKAFGLQQIYCGLRAQLQCERESSVFGKY